MERREFWEAETGDSGRIISGRIEKLANKHPEIGYNKTNILTIFIDKAIKD